MKEKTRLNPQSTDQQPAEIEINQEKMFRAGAEKKFRVAAQMRSKHNPERTIAISLIKRGENALEHIEKWHLLKNAGLPVVPSLRTDERGNVYLTDVRADGGEVYGRMAYYAKIVDKPASRKNIYEEVKTLLDSDFLAIINDPEQFSLLKEEVQRCVDLANDHNIQLPLDDTFELIVKPDGSWKVIILDVVGAETFKQPNKDINSRCGEYFLSYLQHIKGLIQ